MADSKRAGELVTKPPALTVERLAELREKAAAPPVFLSQSELLSLLAMAERSVSEETVRRVEEFLFGKWPVREYEQHKTALCEALVKDTKEAATRLRQGGEGNG